MAEHNIIGKLGEDTAAKMVRKKGFHIRERNWNLGHLEIDIIAENRKEIIFIEVKTRTSTYGGIRPEQHVDYTKQRHIIAAANTYIRRNEIEKRPRFDVIGILINKENKEIIETTYIENAFVPHCKTITENSFSKGWNWLRRKNISR